MVIREAEGLEKELSKAKSALDTAKEVLNQHDKARQAAELGCHAAVSAQERLALESESLQDDLDRAIVEAGRTFEAVWLPGHHAEDCRQEYLPH